MDDVKGKWHGMYSFAKEFGLCTKENTVPFELDAELVEGTFTGKIYEDLSAGGIEDDIGVIGDVLGNDIEFTKFYAHRHVVIDSIRVSGESPGHHVYYKGTWDDIHSTYRGSWEIDSYVFDGDTMLHSISSGIWEMKRS